MEKLLNYNHPAVPQKDIMLGRAYTIEELQVSFTLEEIKCFFEPMNFKWSDLEKQTK